MNITGTDDDGVIRFTKDEFLLLQRILHISGDATFDPINPNALSNKELGSRIEGLEEELIRLAREVGRNASAGPLHDNTLECRVDNLEGRLSQLALRVGRKEGAEKLIGPAGIIDVESLSNQVSSLETDLKYMRDAFNAYRRTLPVSRISATEQQLVTLVSQMDALADNDLTKYSSYKAEYKADLPTMARRSAGQRRVLMVRRAGGIGRRGLMKADRRKR